MKTFLALILIPNFIWALTPEQIVKSSLKHFPDVIQSVQKLEQTKQLTTNARGAFDGKLKGELDSRTQGFYDGDAYKLSLEKPLMFLNSRAYFGHRQSYGAFPSYEGKFKTLDRGELFAGISVSLLRDSLIDMNRYNLNYRKQDEEQAKFNLRQMQINIQTMALKAYWTWFIKGHELKVYERILGLAQKRAKKINRRIKKGDLAKIYGIENKQYIVKRQVRVSQSQLEFQEASFYLSLFNRQADGRPKMPLESELPQMKKVTLTEINSPVKVYDRAVKESLELKNLDSKQKQARLDVKIGTNDILPKLDLNFEWNQDQGQGAADLFGDENRIMLNLEIPLEFRKGLGKRRAGKAKLSQVKTKIQWANEKLKVEVKALLAKLNTFSNIYKLTSEQVVLAEKLANAERKKFSRGVSDLILVNIREENLAEAQTKNLSSLLKYHFIDADVRKIQVQFIN